MRELQHSESDAMYPGNPDKGRDQRTDFHGGSARPTPWVTAWRLRVRTANVNENIDLAGLPGKDSGGPDTSRDCP
ncbi:hypothetical protein Val02_60200 [Virgisporangium aliadipatigenens]|uniref:Uncharacterized protein n=1 Tax=Virgisporangium aliadipatigenens TaxID=741659 RepID=A0A8J4DSV8_9ACTN|nr:hypothetical protein Val02_60200 [Virgisporangium aliadipatigenens]